MKLSSELVTENVEDALYRTINRVITASEKPLKQHRTNFCLAKTEISSDMSVTVHWKSEGCNRVFKMTSN